MRPNNALQPHGERIVWIDQIKGIAFFFVILGHLSLAPVFKSWVFSFHMPVFFFATGCTYNIEKILRTPFSDYLRKLSRRMLIPYVWMQLLCMVPRYLVARIKHGEVPVPTYLFGVLVGNNNLVEAPSNPLYFVLLLFAAELVLFLLVKLAQGDFKKIALFSAMLLPFSLLSQKIHTPWHLNVVPAVIAMILLGNLLMRLYRTHRVKLEQMAPVQYIALVAALFSVGVLLWYFNGRFGLHGNRYGKDFLCAIAAAVCTSVAFALVLMKLPKLSVLTFVGQHTLLYMGLHKPILLVFESLFPSWKEQQWFVWLAAVVCYVLLIPVTLLAEKFAPFVLGKESERGDLAMRVCEVLCVVGATCVPFVYLVNHFHGGVLRSGILMLLLAAVLYLLAVGGLWYVCRTVLRFVFLPKQEQSA